MASIRGMYYSDKTVTQLRDRRSYRTIRPCQTTIYRHCWMKAH